MQETEVPFADANLFVPDNGLSASVEIQSHEVVIHAVPRDFLSGPLVIFAEGSRFSEGDRARKKRNNRHGDGRRVGGRGGRIEED